MRLLVVQEANRLEEGLQAALQQEGLDVSVVQTDGEALELLKRSRFDVVLITVATPGVSGVELLQAIRTLANPPEVVVITEHPGVEAAVAAMKLGAHDYLTKPYDVARLARTIRHAGEKRELQRENIVLRHLVSQSQRLGPVISDSSAMAEVLRTIARVAPARAPVLVTGETGTGKGLVARLIHQQSPRKSEAFVTVNCAALQETLLESELFGHERGAFTGATAVKPGLFEIADGGTLFLDEIGELPLAMQAKLLQVLDAGELRRVGGTKLRRTDVRIVAATNRDLRGQITARKFRQDLFYRLNVIRLHLPPLRERLEDLRGLIDLYRRRFQPPGLPPKTIAPEALQLLQSYSWPGNVREVANAIERAVLLSQGDVIRVVDLPMAIRPQDPVATIDPTVPPTALSEIEKQHILRTLEWTEGRKAAAARLLGINVKTLNNKLKAYESD